MRRGREGGTQGKDGEASLIEEAREKELSILFSSGGGGKEERKE